jgi:hypothetical protein
LLADEKMDAGISKDLVELVRCLSEMLRAGELENAKERVRLAWKNCANIEFNSRAEIILRINEALFKLKRERDQLLAAINSFPKHERIFVRAQIEPVIDEVYIRMIAELKSTKRRCSQPNRQDAGSR